jgi:hypothetical protein
MRHHPVRPTAFDFGFDLIMRTPNYRRFPDWYAATNRYQPHRHEVEATLSAPEAAPDLDAAA